MKALPDSQQEFCGIRQRVAGVLLQHTRTAGAREPGLSQSSMADMLGISRSNVNHSLVSLQSEGAIRFERHRMIINLKALERIAMKTSNARAYVLLRTRNGDIAEATAIVRRQPGVVMADQIEGAADVIFAVQACDQESLAKLTVRAIAAVEDMTEEIQLLPAR